MRSFTRVASFVAAAVAALAIVAPSSVQAQEGVTSFDKSKNAENHFQYSGYNPLMMLSEGPYPAADGLEKRATGVCDPGYGVCR
jgi:hypothetical protein